MTLWNYFFWRIHTHTHCKCYSVSVAISDLWECAVYALCSHTSLQGGCQGSWHSPRSHGSQSSHRSGAADGSHRPEEGHDRCHFTEQSCQRVDINRTLRLMSGSPQPQWGQSTWMDVVDQCLPASFPAWSHSSQLALFETKHGGFKSKLVSAEKRLCI